MNHNSHNFGTWRLFSFLASGVGAFSFSFGAMGTVGAQGNVYLFPENTMTPAAKNVARKHLGAGLLSADGFDQGAIIRANQKGDTNESVLALLSDEVATGTPLAVGKSSLVISLGEAEALGSLAFMNVGAAGKVTVATSPTFLESGDSGWGESRYAVFGTGDSGVVIDLDWDDAKYLKVGFEIAEAGRAYCFGVFGQRDAREFELAALVNVPEGSDLGEPGERNSASDINVASVYAGARVLNASSGEGDTTALIDQNPSTTYELSSGGEPTSITIELGAAFDIDRIGVLGSSGAFEGSIYALSGPPAEGATPDVSGLQPIATISSTEGGAAAAETNGPVSGVRYLVVVITPVGPGPISFGEIGIYPTEDSAYQHGILPGIIPVPGSFAELDEPSDFRYGPRGFAGSNFLRGGSLVDAPERIDEALGERSDVTTGPASP